MVAVALNAGEADAQLPGGRLRAATLAGQASGLGLFTPICRAQLVGFGSAQDFGVAAPYLAGKERYDGKLMAHQAPVKMRLG